MDEPPPIIQRLASIATCVHACMRACMHDDDVMDPTHITRRITDDDASRSVTRRITDDDASRSVGGTGYAPTATMHEPIFYDPLPRSIPFQISTLASHCCCCYSCHNNNSSEVHSVAFIELRNKRMRFHTYDEVRFRANGK